MPATRGFMLYVSAAAVGLLGLGQPTPAEATDASPASVAPSVTTAVSDAAAVAAAAETAAAIASSLSSTSEAGSSSASSSASSSSSISISVTMTPSSSSSASASTPSFSSTVLPSLDNETCQSKTINYITHTLPQQCLRTSWSSANATSTTSGTGNTTGSSGISEAASTETRTSTDAILDEKRQDGGGGGDGKEGEKEKEKAKEQDDDNQEDLATESFMSFEEWKVLQLKKAGQDPADLQARRRQQQHHAGQHPHGAGGDINIDSIGDDGEIALDFDVLNEKVSELAGSAAGQVPGQHGYGSGGEYNRGYQQDGSTAHSRQNAHTDGGASGGAGAPQGDAVLYADGATQYYRSKDAGKTSKERFSFASFDGGATVLKTNKGVKNAKAILVENKDSYMLLECGTRDKHVVVELSDDILVDTVVLANYEFFSSMVRRFRVSVSDRYPVKADRWKSLGEYEARNSRDIQPFLIEHPQIWAKYIRIDFLSHYGSEYYCPLSLLRVHGTRMLDSWKDSENGRDDDDDEEPVQQQGQQHNGQHQAEQKQQEQWTQTETPQHVESETSYVVADHAAPSEPCQDGAGAAAYNPTGYTPWDPILAYSKLFIANSICLPLAAPACFANESVAEAHEAAASASRTVQPSSQPHDPAPAQGKADRDSSSEPPPSHSSFTPSASPSSDSSEQTRPPSANTSSEPLHAHGDSKNTATTAISASDSEPQSSSLTSSILSPTSFSNISSSSHSSDLAAAASTIAAKNSEQEAVAAAAPPPAKHKAAVVPEPPAAPGTPGNQRTPPTTTVQTSQSKDRAASGGPGAGVAVPPGSPSGSAGGTGTNPGATPGGSSGSSGAAAGGAANPGSPPTVQESFFKSVTKRLQLLESNTSLSLQYIEDQSRFLQDALRKMERKQISRVDSFLDTLNQTVLSELRNMRQQYDQIWQSTVIALETQREQNQREAVALSDRLNVLADEVVFQKRMAILQSVLLLCCLALVIFSRGLLAGGATAVPLDVNAAAAVAAAAGYMPLPSASSPSPHSPPSASSPASTIGLRSNLRSLRNNLRNPYASYSVYASGYPLSTYSPGSPPPPNLRAQSPSVNGSGGGVAVPPLAAPLNKNKVLPLTPTTPTSPTSPQSQSSDPFTHGNGDGITRENERSSMRIDGQQRAGQEDTLPLLAVSKPLTPPASLRLSDIEEAADQNEGEEEDSNEDGDDETILSDGTLHPDGSRVDDNDLGLFTPTITIPTRPDTSESFPSISSTFTSEAMVSAEESVPGRKRLPSLPEDSLR